MVRAPSHPHERVNENVQAVSMRALTVRRTRMTALMTDGGTLAAATMSRTCCRVSCAAAAIAGFSLRSL